MATWTSGSGPEAKALERPKVPQRRDPDGTRRKLLAAAKKEFAEKGLAGARVNTIAARAGINKQLVYHYFGSKEQLYVVVLEQAYASFRERDTHLPFRDLEPVEAIRALTALLFDSFKDLRDEIALIADENIHRARHVRNSTRIRGMHQPLVLMMEDIVRRGAKTGTFRQGIDPIRLFILLMSMSSIYISNTDTLSAVFDRDLRQPREMNAWRKFVTDFAVNALRL